MRGIAVGNITEGIRDAGSNAAGAMTDLWVLEWE